MLPVITIFGYPIATYSLLIFLGILLGAVIVIYYFAKFNNISKEDAFFAILYSIIGVGIGAKLLYIITNIPFLIQNASQLNIAETIFQMLQGGFVFYGGLLGGILGILIYAKQFKGSFSSLLLSIVPAIPLVHTVGRIGCLCAGCCYGMEYHGFGAITFNSSPFAPNGVSLFPTQIIEAICNLAIFFVLLASYKKWVGTYKTLGLYFILYSIVRFILEFFRGDLVRGIYFGLSTSQWISIVLFMIGIKIFISKKYGRKIILSLLAR